MPRRTTVVAMFLAAFAVFALAAGLAWGADGLLDPLVNVLPSQSAGLLPPITAVGRKGWDCEAERRATAATATDAGLPTEH